MDFFMKRWGVFVKYLKLVSGMEGVRGVEADSNNNRTVDDKWRGSGDGYNNWLPLAGRDGIISPQLGVALRELLSF